MVIFQASQNLPCTKTSIRHPRAKITHFDFKRHFEATPMWLTGAVYCSLTIFLSQNSLGFSPTNADALMDPK
jgi:hypothetical protein